VVPSWGVRGRACRGPSTPRYRLTAMRAQALRRTCRTACWRIVLTLALASLASSCAVLPSTPVGAQAQATEPARRIQVLNHGWHSGIVVRAADVPGCDWPARCDFPHAEHFEVGWGDRAYYQASHPSLWLGLRALFWPTPGVLHVVAFDGAATRFFTALEVVELEISAQGLRRAVAAIAASHERDAEGRPTGLGPGLYGAGRFYASRQSFHPRNGSWTGWRVRLWRCREPRDEAEWPFHSTRSKRAMRRHNRAIRPVAQAPKR